MKKSVKQYAAPSKTVPENRIAEHRQKRNLSQKELAELANVEVSALNKIENRTRNITGEELITLSRVLRVPTYDLLVVEGPPVPEFYDQIRMDGVIIAVLEAVERSRSKPDPQELAEIIAFLYQRSVTQRLSLSEVRELASSHIRPAGQGRQARVANGR
ncbi:MAG: helix-turn-helix transcriptional regulator [Alphaproteobacteria bacterium]|nr:helix-turn-helix transcriptional regulator [Alphaproteobacteria bacterium]